MFAKHRKIKLLRFLFKQRNKFKFSIKLFVMALEISAYDIAALLYKEFFREINNPYSMGIDGFETE